MNLTYCDYDGDDSESQSSAHMAAARVLTSRAGKAMIFRSGTVSNPELAGFFQDVANTVKKSFVRTNLFPITLTKSLVTGGPSGVVQAIKDEGHAAAGDIAPIGKPIGAVVSIFNPAIGAAIGAASTAAQVDVSRQKAKAATLAQAGDGIPLVKEYQSIAGQIPGRVIGQNLLQQVLHAWVNATGWPPLKGDPQNAAVSTFSTNVQRAVRDGLARGALSAIDIYNNEWPRTWGPDPQQQWMRGGTDDANHTQKLFTIDFIDSELAAQNPNLPMTYGIDPGDVIQKTSPTESAPLAPRPILTAQAPIPLSAGSIAAPPRTYSSRTAVTQPFQQAGVDPTSAAQIAALIDSLRQQGATQAQMTQAALTSLGSRGIATTPAVQQAVETAAAPMTAGLSGLPSWVMFGAAGLALMFALARPARGGRTNRSAFSSRRRNPRRRRRR